MCKEGRLKSSNLSILRYLSTLIMETKSVSEMLVYLNYLTWLLAKEEFIECCSHKNFKTHSAYY